MENCAFCRLYKIRNTAFTYIDNDKLCLTFSCTKTKSIEDSKTAFVVDHIQVTNLSIISYLAQSFLTKVGEFSAIQNSTSSVGFVSL